MTDFHLAALVDAFRGRRAKDILSEAWQQRMVADKLFERFASVLA
jgi:hypothetical protein